VVGANQPLMNQYDEMITPRNENQQNMERVEEDKEEDQAP